MGAWDNGGTHTWRKIRAAVLRQNELENNGDCAVRTRVCTGKAQCVHHVLGREVSGDDPRFLSASCNSCNQHIGKPKSTGLKSKKVTDW